MRDEPRTGVSVDPAQGSVEPSASAFCEPDSQRERQRDSEKERTPARTCEGTHTQTHTHTRTPVCALLHAFVHAHTNTHASRVPARPHSHAHTHLRTHTLLTHVRTNEQARSHVNTDAHARTHVPRLGRLYLLHRRRTSGAHCCQFSFVCLGPSVCVIVWLWDSHSK